MNDPGVCPDCKGPMKALFTGFYCPNDCDKPKPAAKVTTIKTGGTKSYTLGNVGWTMWGMPTPKSPKPDDQCRDFYCGGKGTITSKVYTGQTLIQSNYLCNTCQKPWLINHTQAVPMDAIMVNLVDYIPITPPFFEKKINDALASYYRRQSGLGSFD